MSYINSILKTYDNYLKKLDIINDKEEYCEVLEEKISWIEFSLQ